MSKYALSFATLFLGLAPQSALAHIGIWHPSVYGVNASGYGEEHYYDAPVNTDFIRNPLRLDSNLKFDEWWFHGMRGAKPNAIMELPAGGSVNIEHSCNKAFTSLTSRPDQLDLVGDYPCMINLNGAGRPTYGDPNIAASNGPLHVADESDAMGCALTIQYTNDPYETSPKTFTVFSTNHTCVWRRNTRFQIPEDMPPCPNGKCICSWNWIHGNTRGQGYGNELYHIGFDCNIVGSKSTKKLAKPKLPVLCKDDPKKCVKGAKQALYWEGAQKDGWNVPYDPDTREPPVYNMDWGYANGAQNDIFEEKEEEVKKPVIKAASKTSKTSSTEAVEKTTSSKKASSSTSEDKPTSTTSEKKSSSTEDKPTSTPVTSEDAPPPVLTLQAVLERVPIVTETVVVTQTHYVLMDTNDRPKEAKMKRNNPHTLARRRLDIKGFSRRFRR